MRHLGGGRCQKHKFQRAWDSLSRGKYNCDTLGCGSRYHQKSRNLYTTHVFNSPVGGGPV